jgi:hypothetical protein
MNCKAPVSDSQAKVIFKVFVCPTCFTVAEAIYRRSEQGVQHALIILKDILHQQLVDGKLQLPEKQPEVMSHTEVMRMIVRLQEAYDVARSNSFPGSAPDRAVRHAGGSPRRELPVVTVDPGLDAPGAAGSTLEGHVPADRGDLRQGGD